MRVTRAMSGPRVLRERTATSVRSTGAGPGWAASDTGWKTAAEKRTAATAGTAATPRTVGTQAQVAEQAVLGAACSAEIREPSQFPSRPPNGDTQQHNHNARPQVRPSHCQTVSARGTTPARSSAKRETIQIVRPSLTPLLYGVIP